MRDAMRRYYAGEPADVTVVLDDHDIHKVVPEHLPDWQEYINKVVREATPEGQVVGEMMLTRREEAPTYILELWLEDE